MPTIRTALYPMPTAAALPADGPSWPVDPLRSALLVQQMQNQLLQPLRGRAPVGQLLSNVSRLTQVARSVQVPVVYVLRVAGEQGTAWADADERPAARPPAGAGAVADVVRPQPGDTVFTAKRYSAFAGTRLRARLRELGRDQLILVGGPARTDVLLTAADAWMQDLRPFVIADAVIEATAEDHAMAVRWLAGTCAALRTTDSVVEAFRTAHPEPEAV
ncbi:isochorismatase family protein [Streptomyces sp. NPDC127039]|uniref:isochorismatase family protein n=1 Tax=Streptomyces sp. NPDC127039 TaxID=3347115 RepID=UPI0036513BD5